jgi:CheY-like chemotaxis protein
MKPTRFIIVDDDNLDIKLCKLYIRHTLPDIEIVSFNIAEEALIYFQSAFSIEFPANSVLLLDVNMPGISGWEFLEKYDALDQKIKDQIRIYILSSSVDLRDQKKAASAKYISGYLIKPVTTVLINKLYEECVFTRISNHCKEV